MYIQFAFDIFFFSEASYIYYRVKEKNIYRILSAFKNELIILCVSVKAVARLLVIMFASKMQNKCIIASGELTRQIDSISFISS